MADLGTTTGTASATATSPGGVGATSTVGATVEARTPATAEARITVRDLTTRAQAPLPRAGAAAQIARRVRHEGT